jgi:D-lactate dehydrogenase
MKRIAIFEISEWEKDYLNKALLNEFQLLFFDVEIQFVPIQDYIDADIISVFIYSQVSSKIISSMSNLKRIATRSTGYDHIDLVAAKQKNIQVLNVPYYGENTVAEHTFALILSLSRNIHKSYLRSTQNDFNIEGLMGFDLKSKTIGIIGGGHIGQHVIRIAKGFGMEVLVCDVTQNNFLSEVLDFKYVDFDYLLANSDIISLHVPYNTKTHHLINSENIIKFKPGSILINTSRGGLVEIEALISALDSGILSGAGLDVLEGEDLIRQEEELFKSHTNPEAIKRLIQDHILIKKDNVVFTPHIAFYSREAIQRILDTTVQNFTLNENQLKT